jgi:hypothetical protein
MGMPYKINENGNENIMFAGSVKAETLPKTNIITMIEDAKAERVVKISASG